MVQFVVPTIVHYSYAAKNIKVTMSGYSQQTYHVNSHIYERTPVTCVQPLPAQYSHSAECEYGWGPSVPFFLSWRSQLGICCSVMDIPHAPIINPVKSPLQE